MNTLRSYWLNKQNEHTGVLIYDYDETLYYINFKAILTCYKIL